MNKMLFFSLFCFWTLAACRGGNSRHRNKGQDTSMITLKDVSAQADLTGVDTALFSLKTFKSVALTDVLSQVWKFEENDKLEWNELFRDSVSDPQQYPQLVLFSDHYATLNPRRGLQMGQWQLNKDTRELTIQWNRPAAGQTKYTIREIALKQLELGWSNAEGPVVIKLSAGTIVHRRPPEDPFYPANNQWRIKPSKPETAEQIRMRVKNCVHFYALFYQDNHQREETQISFSGFPTCFIWYNGGIGIEPRATLDKSWIDCFYSYEQAMQGYKLIEAELEKHALKWPEHPTSWVKQTGEVLEQLAGKL
ncbi:MAG TPA: hypothetical protein VNS58_23525 [Puia sp.]|nr:hypothetical protein [Puia sp.]